MTHATSVENDPVVVAVRNGASRARERAAKYTPEQLVREADRKVSALLNNFLDSVFYTGHVEEGSTFDYLLNFTEVLAAYTPPLPSDHETRFEAQDSLDYVLARHGLTTFTAAAARVGHDAKPDSELAAIQSQLLKNLPNAGPRYFEWSAEPLR